MFWCKIPIKINALKSFNPQKEAELGPDRLPWCFFAVSSLAPLFAFVRPEFPAFSPGCGPEPQAREVLLSPQPRQGGGELPFQASPGVLARPAGNRVQAVVTAAYSFRGGPSGLGSPSDALATSPPAAGPGPRSSHRLAQPVFRRPEATAGTLVSNTLASGEVPCAGLPGSCGLKHWHLLGLGERLNPAAICSPGGQWQLTH